MEKSQRQKDPSSQAGGRSRRRRVKSFSQLLNISFRLLQSRPHSTQEIINRLRRHTQDTATIDAVIAKLKSLKFIDDAKFAQWLIESRSRSRPRGKRLLARELKSKGVQAKQIDIDEIALATSALAKKLPRWKDLSYREFRAKAGRFLASRGFSWDAIETVIRKGYNQPDVN